MPFIKEEDRLRFDVILQDLPDFENKGELEYCVYALLVKFMKTREERYSTLHEAVYGAIHAGEEFKRLRLDKREDKAREQNGDIE